MGSWTWEPGGRAAAEARADLDALDGLDAHERLREAPVELAVPLHVAAEAGHARPVATTSKTPAERVAGVRGRRGWPRASPPRPRRRRRPGRWPARARAARRGRRSTGGAPRPAPIATTWAKTSIPDRGEQLAAHRAHAPSRGGLARARPLEDVAQIVPVVLQAPGEVGVAGARARERLGRGGQGRGRHAVQPVRVVAVGDRHGDGRAERLAAAHAADELDAVGLDLHPAAPAVAALTPRQVGVDVARRAAAGPEGMPSTMAVSRGPVRLSRGEPAQARHRRQTLAPPGDSGRDRSSASPCRAHERPARGPCASRCSAKPRAKREPRREASRERSWWSSSRRRRWTARPTPS